jgi:site-specific DNA recombinase
VRPEYRRLLDDVREGRVHRLLVYMTDRLYRQPRELEDLIDLVEGRRVQIGTVRSGELDLSTPEGRAFARNAATWNKLEAEKLSERVARTKAARLAEGRWLGGGRRAYGYRRVDGAFKVDAKEARIIRRIADRIIRGDTLYAIVSELNERGVPTASGGRWSYAGLRSVLLGAPSMQKRGTPFVAGGADWPAIVDADRIALVRARWPKTPKRLRPGGRRGILSGIASCSECTYRMRLSSGFYRCNVSAGGCGRISVKAVDLDHWVVSTTAYAAPFGVEPSPEEDVDVEAILARLRALEERAAEVEAAIADGSMPVRIGAKTAAKIETHRAAVEAELAAAPGYRRSLPRVDFTRADKATRLPDAPVDDLRAFVSHFVERLVVQPPSRRRSRPEERAEIVWRRPEIMNGMSVGAEA